MRGLEMVGDVSRIDWVGLEMFHGWVTISWVGMFHVKHYLVGVVVG